MISVLARFIEHPTALFLAVVFAASAIDKRRPEWGAELAAYPSLPAHSIHHLRWAVPALEFMTAVVLATGQPVGLLQAGALLFSYSLVLSLAMHLGHSGSCGCASGSGRATRTKALRALVWGLASTCLPFLSGSAMEAPVLHNSIVLTVGEIIIFGLIFGVIRYGRDRTSVAGSPS